MAFNKITLRKKWWEGNTYKIYDEEERVIAFSEQPSFFSSTLNIYGIDGQLLLELKKHWLSTGNYEFIKQGRLVGKLLTGWTGMKYVLELEDLRKYTLAKKGWGKRIEIYKNNSTKNVGLISGSSMSFNEVGAVAEDIDPIVLAACVIAINAIKRASS